MPVRIVTIQYDPVGSDVTNESVLVENTGPAAVAIGGWRLSDAAGNTFTVPGSPTLAPGGQIRVWTKAGANNAANLFWGSGAAIWNNNPGDVAVLRDAANVEQARYSYRNFVADPRPLGLGGGGALFAPAVSPFTAATMFVSCDMTGLYRSTDSGLHWHLLDNRVVQGSTRFGVAFDPARQGHLLAFHPVQGLQESFDDGVGFGPISPALPVSGGRPPRVTSVGFAPDAPGRVLAGTTTGLRILDPGAASWRAVGTITDDVVAVVLPGTGRPYFCATVNDVFRSTDGGQTWTSIGATLPARPAGPFEPTVPPNDPSYVASRIRGFTGARLGAGYVLFATVATQLADVQQQPNGSKVLTSGGVYRFTDTTGLWARETPNVVVTQGDQGGGTPIPRYERLAMSPGQADIAYVTVIPTTFDPLVQKRVMVDGIWTWRGVFRWTTSPVNVEFGWFEAAGPPAPRFGFGLGGAPRGLAVAPGDPATVAVTNNAAVYVTDTGGTGATGGQPDWRQRFTTAIGTKWLTSGLDVTTVWRHQVHPADRNLTFACCTDVGLARSTNRGDSWESIVWSDIGAAAQRRWGNFYQLAFEGQVGQRIWAAVSDQHDIPHESQVRRTSVGAGAVLVSTDAGASWRIAHGAPLPGPVVGIVFTAGTLYAAVWGAGVYRSTDGGGTWTPHGSFPSGASLRCHSLQMRSSTLYCSVSADFGVNPPRPGNLYQFDPGSGAWQPVGVAGGTTLQQAAGAAVPVPVDFGFGSPSFGSADLYLCMQSIQGSNGGGGVYQLHRTQGWQKLNVPFPADFGDTVQAFAVYQLWVVEGGLRRRLFVTSSHGVWYTDNVSDPPASQVWKQFLAAPFLNTHRIDIDPFEQASYLSTFGGGVYRLGAGLLPWTAG